MATKIKIIFNSVPAAGTVLSIGDVLLAGNLIETFVDSRSQAYESTRGITAGGCMANYGLAFEFDYNVLGLYTLEYDWVNDWIIIYATNPASQFSIVTNDTAGAITTDITNEAPPTAITLDTLTISGGDCNNVEFTGTTDIQADSLILPISEVVSTNPHVFTVPRVNDVITVQFGLGAAESNALYAYVPQLLVSQFSVDITPQVSGGSIVINNTWANTVGMLRLTLEYSLDGVNYFPTNSFSGLAPNPYTAYIKDSLGCEITIAFTIDAFGGGTTDVDPIAEVSNCNSFRFKTIEAWANCGTQRNVNNTLSWEEKHRLTQTNFKQNFQTCDVITTQIKSTYETLSAKAIDCDGNESIASVIQKTSNINNVDVRDCKIWSITDGQYAGYTALILNEGNIYDPDTQAVNGTYDFGTSLPSWIEVGGTINVEGQGWFNILEIAIFIIDDIESIIIDLPNTHGIPDLTSLKATTVYTIVPYERHEFVVDMNLLGEGCYYIQIDITDSRTGFDARSYRSEWFCVHDVYEEDHHYIEYYNSKTNEINYSTGIVNKLRLPFEMQLKWKPSDEQEIYVTDTKTIHLDSKVREMYEMALMPLPTGMAQKIALMLAHNRINIDGMNCLMEGNVEVESMGATNMYRIKATLVKSDYVFDNTNILTTGDSFLLPDGSPIEIDEDSGGFLITD